MFGSKNTPSAKPSVGTLIARNAAIEGTIKFTGDLIIEGSVSGDILAEDGVESKVEVIANGRVKGEVRAPDVIINGRISGDVFASGQLILASEAIVDGNVHYNLIEMEKGAQINGKMVHEIGGADQTSNSSPNSIHSPKPTPVKAKKAEPETIEPDA